LTAANSAVDQRTADLIKRYGYDAVKAAVDEQQPPHEPPRRGPKRLRYQLEDELAWLTTTRERWEAEGKPSVWPCLMAVAEKMPALGASVKSRAHRLRRRLRDTEPEVLLDKGLMELAQAVGKKGHWFPYAGPLPNSLMERRRSAQIEFHNKLCTVLLENANSLSPACLASEIRDLSDIVRRKENFEELALRY
jgi:hypothetical protein